MKKFRVAIYYESKDNVGRNDGPPLYWWNVLRNMEGVEVHHIIPNPNLPPVSKFGEFDLHIWVDWGEDGLGLPYKIMECPKPSIYVTSDTHFGYDYRLNKAKEFDHVFCNQKRAVEEFEKDGVEASWLPHAVEPQAYPDMSIVKKYDVAFIGHLCNDKRIDFLDRMFKEFPNFWYGQRLFEEAAKIFCESKIVLNTAAIDDVNMRVFEATATGSFLLTENLPSLSELYEDGVHLVTYDSLEDAIEKAHYYLEHDEEREKIALAGKEHTLKNHTYLHRVQEVMKQIGGPDGIRC